MQTFSNGTYLTRTHAGSESRTLDNKKPLSFPATLPGLWYIGVLVPQSNGVKRISDLVTTYQCVAIPSFSSSFIPFTLSSLILFFIYPFIHVLNLLISYIFFHFHFSILSSVFYIHPFTHLSILAISFSHVFNSLPI